MADNIKAIGSKITWKTWVFILGLTEDATWVNIKTIRNTDMVFTNGLMVDFISVTGCAENNMDLEFTRLLRLTSNMVFGKKVKELNGLTMIKFKKSKMARKTLGTISKSRRTNKHKYMDPLRNRTISINNSKKYNRDSVLLLITSLIEANILITVELYKLLNNKI